jgi:acetyl-CoA carboxylase carboxyltransferase component
LEDHVKRLKAVKQKIIKGDDDKIGKIHASGKYTARERINLLLDKGTFYELNAIVGFEVGAYGDGIVAGYGEIDGRTVCVYAQDSTVLGGSVGYLHGSKLYKIIERAYNAGVPVIGLNDNPGGRIQRLDSPGPSTNWMTDEKHGASVFMINTIASGVIPQISAILGSCAGIGAYSPALTDFVFMVDGTAHLFVTGPRVVKMVMSEDISNEDLGGAKVHCITSGVADIRFKTEDDCIREIRKLLSFLPSNFREKPPVRNSGDSPERKGDILNKIVPVNPYKAFDMHKVIREIVDDGDFFEIKPEFAAEIIVGFCRLNGHTTGLVANQPMVRAGCMTVDSSDKQARFIRFCDAFNIPLVLLIDTPAYLPGKNQEHAGIIRHGSKVLYALCEATVPKVAIIIRKVYGGGALGMGAMPGLGTDLVFAWPIAEWGIMGAEPSTEIMFAKEIKQVSDPEVFKAEKVKEYREQYSNPIAISSKCTEIHDVIEPADTRAVLIRSLKVLENKSLSPPAKKHGNIPL